MNDSGPELLRELSVLEARRATGRLEVRSAEGGTTLVYFVDGQLTYAEGGSVGDTLGRVLLREGALTRTQYAEIIRVMTDQLVEHEQVRFGEVAVRLGYLTPAVVGEGLSWQVRSRMFGCLQHENTERIFDEGPEFVETSPRFPIALGPTLRTALELFYDKARLAAALEYARDARWFLRDPDDVGETRFEFSPEELALAQTLSEPVVIWELLDSDPSIYALRTVLLLRLGGLLVDEAEKEALATEALERTSTPGSGGPEPEPETERPPPRETRAPTLRSLHEDVSGRAVPSVRAPDATRPSSAPPGVEPAMTTNPSPPPKLEPIVVPAAPPQPEQEPDTTPKLGHGDLARARQAALARARVLQRLAGGARPPAGTSGAGRAVEALRERHAASAETASPETRTLEAATQFERGRSALDAGQPDVARHAFEVACNLHDDDEYRLHLAWAGFLTASSDEATAKRDAVKAMATQCLRADRRLSFGHYVIGRLALIDGDYESAHRALRRAVALDPEQLDAARHLRLAQQRGSAKKR